MKKQILGCIWLAIVIAIITSCQSQQKENQPISDATIDTVDSQNIKPSETGYAEVNGLKMYYEIYGTGQPIVLLHGSYLTIPMNWSHIIPLMVKGRG